MTFDFGEAEIRELLEELDRRLRMASVGASLYVVGGAAIALQVPGSGRRTQDIDAITTSDGVASVVRAMAEDLGLPDNWLNGAAAPFVPPSPTGALEPPTSAGLRVSLAPLTHLLAMKLVAGRARDRADITTIATALDIDADAAVELTIEIYGIDALEILTTTEDVQIEAEAAIRKRMDGVQGARFEGGEPGS